MRRVWTVVGVVLFGVMQLGCGAPPATEPSRRVQADGASKPRVQATTADKRKPAPEKPARTFASIHEAMVVLAEASEGNDSAARTDATKYLIAQGSAALPALAERLADPQVNPRTAIVICRTLGQLGPSALDPLVGALDHSSSAVRVNAAEQLAIIRPTNEEVIDTLLKLVDHEDQQLRLIAIRGLGHVGKAAQRSSHRLQALRNSPNESDTLRTAAGEALKKVDPRKTLVN